MVVGEMSQNPLGPDDVVTAGFRFKVLQSGDEASIQFGAFGQLSELDLGLLEEIAVQFHHVHFVEKREEKVFGNPANPGAAV